MPRLTSPTSERSQPLKTKAKERSKAVRIELSIIRFRLR
ncbi:Uncharacterised protein [Vibrio cholerae]|nr:Uncharacterised protein [Vibrio cholerae]CSC01324.1 Uncharacterised protein [Vibrio cholerae]